MIVVILFLINIEMMKMTESEVDLSISRLNFLSVLTKTINKASYIHLKKHFLYDATIRKQRKIKIEMTTR